MLMGDGAVVFITDSIESGNAASPGVSLEPGFTGPGSKSPYGLWGALGSRASKEVVEEQLSNIPPGAALHIPTRNETAAMSVWKDRDGKNSLRAAFIEIIDEELIRLQDSAGVIHEVPLNTLDGKDIYRAVEMDVMQKRK